MAGDDDQPSKTEWWQASDGRWYPPDDGRDFGLPSYQGADIPPPANTVNSYAADAHFPPHDIVDPRGLSASLVRIFGPVFAIAAVAVLVANHTSSGIEGVLIAFAILAVIIGVEVPWLLRRQQERQDQDLQGLPQGGIYRGRATLISASGEVVRLTSGLMFLGNVGWSFTRKDDTDPILTVDWHDVARLSLGPRSRGIGVGHLVMQGADGRRWAFSVPRYARLAEALRSHTSGHK
jgi:hypothetical protein